MTTFQFYKKLNALVHVNIDAPAFINEKKQLIEQGFERVGNIVQAETSYAAFNKCKAIHFNELQHFNKSHLFVSTSFV